MENINALILSIIDFPNQHQMIIENAEDDIQCFRNTYDGVIEDNVFMKLISQSQNNYCIERFLSALIISVTPMEITDTVFSALLEYNGEYRMSILIGLAHCPLSFFQLVKLNKLKIEEALFQLIKIYMCNDCFTKYDLLEIFKPWKNMLTPSLCYNILYCLDNRHTEKSNYIRNYVERANCKNGE